MDDSRGVLQPGYDADLVLCTGDPLRDISRLASPENVALLCSRCHLLAHGTLAYHPRPPKTRCAHGHPLDGENLYAHSAGERHCRTRKRAAQQLWYRSRQR